MATQTSPTTGQRYGVSRVCQIWALARSSFYAARQQKAAVAPHRGDRGRGRSRRLRTRPCW